MTGCVGIPNVCPVVPAGFKNLLRADSPAQILHALAEAAVGEVGADGVAVVEVLPNGEAKVVEARHLPDAAANWRAEVDVIDAEIGERLLAACEGRFVSAQTLPLMSGGDLFGALVVFRGEERLSSELEATEALVDLAAITFGKAQQLEELRKSYAELRHSREVLERTEKLRALGEMAAGISHDLKNILNPLSLHLQLLKRILKRGGPGAEEAIGEMEHVLRRGVETVERLRDFSRQTPEKRIEEVDLDAVAHEAVELSRPRIASARRPRGVRVVEELTAPPRILARSTELVAALLNLIANAIDAMVDGGTVTVSTGSSEAASPGSASPGSASPGSASPGSASPGAADRLGSASPGAADRLGSASPGAWVRVHDDGPGIPPEIQDRIFEPFFTTKGKEGTGLGLAMVYAFVQRHGGKLTLETSPEKGTSFLLWFPAAR